MTICLEMTLSVALTLILMTDISRQSGSFLSKSLSSTDSCTIRVHPGPKVRSVVGSRLKNKMQPKKKFYLHIM
jgi:hypothetical protein